MGRLECWNNAAKYSLNEDTIKTVLEWPEQKALVTYMQGLLSTALVCIRTDLPNSARTYGQHTVFSGLRAPETQLHLGLCPTESIMEQQALAFRMHLNYAEIS